MPDSRSSLANADRHAFPTIWAGLAYYLDFILYPALILILGGAFFLQAPISGWPGWIALFFATVLAWTLFEYLLHRFPLHRWQPMMRLHDAHHHEPTALVGTPTWMSLLPIGALVLAPLWLSLGFAVASPVTAGVMAGWLWFITMHHGVHHWSMRHDTYFYRMKRRHAQHHYGSADTEFGVTTGFWDRVFGTCAKPAGARVMPGQPSRADVVGPG